MINFIKSRKALLFSIFVAFLIRVVYVVAGYVLKGESFFTNGDTASYTDSFINLLQKGIYSFDLRTPDAAFGRLPGYPFFFGIHYLLFKQYVFLAVGITQALLDSIVVYFLYRMAMQITKDERAAIIGAWVYTLYVFSIFWVPTIGTESLAVFCTVFYFYLASKEKFESNRWYITLSLVCIAAFYVREYLGILFPITIFYFLKNRKVYQFTVKKFFLFVIPFVAIYSLWPMRNYLSFHKIELIKPPTAGYRTYGPDFNSFRSWMYTWHIDVEPYFSRIMQNKNPEFPDYIFKDQQQHLYVDQLVMKGMNCGSSFYAWRSDSIKPTNCDTEVANNFVALRREFIQRRPYDFYLLVPLRNISKAFFKSSLNNEPKSTLKKMAVGLMFFYRTFLVIAGFLGGVFLVRTFAGYLITTFSIFMYLFISTIIRQVEMRYLLQADVSLLVLAIGFFYSIYYKYRKGNVSTLTRQSQKVLDN
jgi:hypothetical protein